MFFKIDILLYQLRSQFRSVFYLALIAILQIQILFAIQVVLVGVPGGKFQRDAAPNLIFLTKIIIKNNKMK